MSEEKTTLTMTIPYNSPAFKLAKIMADAYMKSAGKPPIDWNQEPINWDKRQKEWAEFLGE